MITCSATSCLFPAGRLAQMPGPTCPDCVSCASCVSLSAPSPCERRYRLRVLWADPTPEGHRLSYLSFRIGLPAREAAGTVRVSQVLVRFSRHMPRSLWTPADLRKAHLYRFLCVGFWTVNTIAICSRWLSPPTQFTGLYQASGNTVSLVAYVVPCVRFNDVVRSLMSEICVWRLDATRWSCWHPFFNAEVFSTRRFLL